jgi:hypothetical protein
MANRRAVCDLAKELGVSSVRLLELARKDGVKVRRVAALLTAAQEQRLRELHAQDVAARREQANQLMRRHETTPPPEPRYGRCECCDQHFPMRPDEAWCQRCKPHVAATGEPLENHLARERDHADLYRSQLRAAGEAAASAKAQMRAAFASRDKWRRLLVETALAHEANDQAGCVCGAAEYPCVTRRSIEYRNIGIAKQIEALEGLSEEDFEKFLYGDDRLLYPLDGDTE